MSRFLFIVGLFAASLAVPAEEILFTNTVVTFTNLQGTRYDQVKLVRASPAGLIWRKAAGGGLIRYTNLAPSFLNAIGIPDDWIRTAPARAAREAQAQAQFRALLAAKGQEAQMRRTQAQQRTAAEAYYESQAKAAQAARLQAQQQALWNSVPPAPPPPYYYPGAYDWDAPMGWGATPYSSWAYGWSPALGWWANTTSSSTTMHNPWN